MRRYIGVSFLMLTLAGCSPLQQALKSEDMELKKEVANDFFEQKKYRRALRLYEQLETPMRGRTDAEQMYYNFAEATFILKDYETAGPRYRNFAASYPRSEKREEALLKEIKSGLPLSREYSFDQHETYQLIEKLQRFIDQYPTSDYVFEANSMMVSLNEKLEKKAFENAKHLNTIGEWTRNYGAAMLALDNFIYDYPGTKFKEEALFYKLDSAHKLAMNSVASKEEERLKSAKLMYETLVRFEPDGVFRSKADDMMEEINKELEKFSK